MIFRRIILALWALAALAPLALAQSSPGLTQHQVPTATQWNSYFSSKADNLQTATGSPTPRTLADRAADVVNAADYGVVADYVFGGTGTDNTSKLAIAIAAAQSTSSQGVGKRLVLPAGAILTGPQTVTAQLDIDGASSSDTVLVLKSGSNAPALKFLLAGYNYPNDGHPAAQVKLSNFRITSEDGGSVATNTATPLAAGIDFHTGGLPTFAYLLNITTYNMPGDGVVGTSFLGYVLAEFLYSHNNGGNGFSSNSNNDWSILHSQIDGNYKDGVVSSGDSRFSIENLNSFSNRQHGVHLFGRETVTLTGHNEFNLNYFSGLWLDTLTTDARIFVGPEITFGSNSQVGAATYGAVTISGGAGNMVMIGQHFPKPFALDGGNAELANFVFLLSSTTQIFCDACQFEAGSPKQANVTNVQAQLQTTGIVPGSGWVSTGTWTFGGACSTYTGTGVPAVAAPVCSLFLRTDGGAASTLYVKESGTGTTGWTAK